MMSEKIKNSDTLLGAIARGWCSPENAHKVIDPDLAVAISEEVQSFVTAERKKMLAKPWEYFDVDMSAITIDDGVAYVDTSRILRRKQ